MHDCLKTSFCKVCVGNSCFSDEINCEATKVLADAHLKKSHPGKGILLNTAPAFLKSFGNYIRQF